MSGRPRTLFTRRNGRAARRPGRFTIYLMSMEIKGPGGVHCLKSG